MIKEEAIGLINDFVKIAAMVLSGLNQNWGRDLRIVRFQSSSEAGVGD